MNYNKLKYFYEISKIKSLTNASKVLFVSQSSLSKAISDLEKDFGTELFLRTNNSLVLTEAGKELLKRVEPFFSEEEELYRSVRAASKKNADEVKATLHVGHMASHTSLFLPDFVKEFEKSHPNVNVVLHRYNKAELMKYLANKSLDMVYLIHSIEEASSDLCYTELIEHRLSMIARNDHPLASRKIATLTDFKKDRFVMHGHRDTSNEYENAIIWCKRCGFMPQIVGEYDYVETVLTQVEAGSGVSILSDASPYSRWKNLVSIPLENAPIIYDGVFWRKEEDTAFKHKEEMKIAAGIIFREEFEKYINENELYNQK